MKKILLLFILILFTLTGYASGDNLYKMFEDYYEIKVFLKGVIDKTENPDVKIDVFKNVFEDVARERINIKFTPVYNEEDADVVIVSGIKEYVFTEKAPPVRAAPLFLNAIAVVADTAEPKSTGKLVVDYEIQRPGDGTVLFSYKNLTTEARKPQEDMKGEMGYIYAVKENVNRFIFRAFYKRGNR